MPPKKRLSDPQQNSQRGTSVMATHHSSAGANHPRSANSIQQRSHVVPSRGRPPKRFQTDDTLASNLVGEHQSFIMKLFDRSLDLAKYPSKSALYPICRAWMLNQPRSDKLINFKRRILPPPAKRSQHNRLLDDLVSGKIADIRSMPAVRQSPALHRIPTPLPADNDAGGNVNLNYDLDDPAYSRGELLRSLKSRSVAVRKHWQQHTYDYEQETYGKSFELLNQMYKV